MSVKIENIIRRVLREQEEEKLSELPPFDDFFENDWNLVLNFMNRYPNKKFYYPGDLYLGESDIETLGNLVKVEGKLDLYGNESFQSLGKLKHVGSWLNLLYCKNLKSLGDLEYVGGYLDLRETNIKSLVNLEYVGGWLDIGDSNVESLGNLEYVGGFLSLGYTPLSKKYTIEEIRNMVEVVGKVYL